MEKEALGLVADLTNVEEAETIGNYQEAKSGPNQLRIISVNEIRSTVSDVVHFSKPFKRSTESVQLEKRWLTSWQGTGKH